MILLPAAFAADLSWRCEPLAAAADGAAYREPDSLGTREAFAVYRETILAAYDEGCPDDNDPTAIVDACVSDAGDELSVVYLEEDEDVFWSAELWPAEGELLALRLEWSSIHTEDYPREEFSEAGRASWTGTLDGHMDRSVSHTSGIAGFYLVDPSAWESWDDGSCTWSVWRGEEEGLTRWEIRVGSQVLDVEEDACGRARAELDGVATGVEPVSWAPLAADADADGTPDADDCGPTDATVHPCAVDDACDGVDLDCDGLDSSDADGDGHLPECSGGDDCDDADPTVRPGAGDRCDEVDQDCDGDDGCDDTGSLPVEPEAPALPPASDCGCGAEGGGAAALGIGVALVVRRGRSRPPAPPPRVTVGLDRR